MPYIYVVKSVSDSNQYHSSDETRETTVTYYSTLKSANRAARQEALSSRGEEDEDDDELDERYDGDGCYSAEGQISKYEVWSVSVERVVVLGPDLAKGEKDESSEEEGGEEDDEEEENEDEDRSSDVEIVEPPSKRTKTK
jgi:hypothetical protein